MVKIIFCLRRRQGMTREDFQTYWATTHAPKVVERARKLGIRKYVQSHTISDNRLSGLAEQRGTQAEPFDGVAELWCKRCFQATAVQGMSSATPFAG